MEENKSLTVKDDAVSLPVLSVVQGESNEFRSLVKEAFPPTISEEVCEIRRGSEQGYSRLGILVTILFCVTVLYLSYNYWPRPIPPVSTKAIDVKDDTPPVQKDYMVLAKVAQELLAAKKYTECAHLLLEPLESMMKITDDAGQKKCRDNRKLFVLYCSAVIDGKLRYDYAWKCKDFLSFFQKIEPDDFKWHSFWLMLESDELLRFFERIETTNLMRLARIETCLEKADYVILRDGELNKGEHQEGLNLIKTKLLIAAWLLKGASTGLPDNIGDPGVYEREQAYSLACQYPNSRDFIRLRIFILDKMITHSGIFNKYYFRGNVYFSNTWLEDERNTLQNRMGGAR